MHADVIKRLNAHVARDIAKGGVGGGGGGGPDTMDPPPASAPNVSSCFVRGLCVHAGLRCM